LKLSAALAARLNSDNSTASTSADHVDAHEVSIRTGRNLAVTRGNSLFVERFRLEFDDATIFTNKKFTAM
jgi:hypothetical protein